MLVIRLQRTGRTNLPSFRLVVAEKARSAKGKFQEIVGHYLPAQNPPVFEVVTDRVTHWVKNGAQPSDTVARLLKRHGVQNMERFIQRYAKRKSKNPEAEAAAPAAAPAPTPAPAAETEAAPAA
jgi:small subunit ribosomal protein S16